MAPKKSSSEGKVDAIATTLKVKGSVSGANKMKPVLKKGGNTTKKQKK